MQYKTSTLLNYKSINENQISSHRLRKGKENKTCENK